MHQKNSSVQWDQKDGSFFQLKMYRKGRLEIFVFLLHEIWINYPIVKSFTKAMTFVSQKQILLSNVVWEHVCENSRYFKDSNKWILVMMKPGI